MINGYDGPLGWRLAMRVLQSDLYSKLDDSERAECDALIESHFQTIRKPVSKVLRRTQPKETEHGS
jgi:hypothetical protein